MTSISREMAQFALSLDFNEIPLDAIKEAKRSLLDCVGCAFAAYGNEDMEAAHMYIKNLGGVKQATVIAYGTRTHIANSTFMNSLLIRALDYNDIYWEQDPSHPSDIIPAALSSGEWLGRSGKDILIGIVVAYELEMRLCNAAQPGIREIGWHHASLTQLVSPLVSGRMLNLSEDEMVSAVGISGSSHFTLGGVVAGALTNMKNTADPMAVEAGVRAALLAREGYRGPEEVYEGKEGVFEVINDVKWNKDKLLDGLGRKFLITQCGYKAFPTEALTHQPITAVLSVMEENNITYEEVKEVLIETTKRGSEILSDPFKYNPKTKETADHSLPYCVACAIVKGNVLPSDFEEEAIFDERVRKVLQLIKVKADPEIDSLFPHVKRAIVTIKTDRGEFTKVEDHAKGQPERPLSDEELIDKFKANTDRKLSNDSISKIVDDTMDLESINNINNYTQKLVI